MTPETTSGRRAAVGGSATTLIHRQLRQDIFSGALSPGDILNTVHLAEKYHVSRMPVREALRMLQADGLVDAAYNHRMQVRAISPEEVDSVYANWLMLESLAVGITAERNTADELLELREVVDRLGEIRLLDQASRASWAKLHTAFRRLVIRHAGETIGASIEACWLQTERARRMASGPAQPHYEAADREHRGILLAFESQSAAEAASLAGLHMARVGLDALRRVDPEYRPQYIGRALAMVAGPAAAQLAPTVEA